MNGRLKKRGALALIIYFLMISAVSTPIAFYTGKARGAERARFDDAAGQGLSQNETDANDAEPPISLAMALESGAPADTGQANIPGGQTARAFFGPRSPSLKPAALRDAVIRAIAGEPSGASGNANNKSETPSPFSLAMSPDMPGGFMQGGTVTPGSGYPGAIIPGTFSANIETPPGNPKPPPTNGPGLGNPGGETPGIEEPPVLVTPVPAALPLMMTGFAGLMALRRRSRR